MPRRRSRSGSPSSPVWHLPPGLHRPPSRLTRHELLCRLQAQGIVVRRLIALFGPDFRVSYATKALPESTIVTSLCEPPQAHPRRLSSHQCAPGYHHHSTKRNLRSSVWSAVATPSPSASHHPLKGRGGGPTIQVPWSSVVFHGSHHFQSPTGFRNPTDFTIPPFLQGFPTIF